MQESLDMDPTRKDQTGRVRIVLGLIILVAGATSIVVHFLTKTGGTPLVVVTHEGANESRLGQPVDINRLRNFHSTDLRVLVNFAGHLEHRRNNLKQPVYVNLSTVQYVESARALQPTIQKVSYRPSYEPPKSYPYRPSGTEESSLEQYYESPVTYQPYNKQASPEKFNYTIRVHTESALIDMQFFENNTSPYYELTKFTVYIREKPGDNNYTDTCEPARISMRFPVEQRYACRQPKSYSCSSPDHDRWSVLWIEALEIEIGQFVRGSHPELFSKLPYYCRPNVAPDDPAKRRDIDFEYGIW